MTAINSKNAKVKALNYNASQAVKTPTLGQPSGGAQTGLANTKAGQGTSVSNFSNGKPGAAGSALEAGGNLAQNVGTPATKATNQPSSKQSTTPASSSPSQPTQRQVDQSIQDFSKVSQNMEYQYPAQKGYSTQQNGDLKKSFGAIPTPKGQINALNNAGSGTRKLLEQIPGLVSGQGIGKLVGPKNGYITKDTVHSAFNSIADDIGNSLFPTTNATKQEDALKILLKGLSPTDYPVASKGIGSKEWANKENWAGARMVADDLGLGD